MLRLRPGRPADARPVHRPAQRGVRRMNQKNRMNQKSRTSRTSPATAKGVTYSVVVPTIGRPSLYVLIDTLTARNGPPPEEIIVVDDRARPEPALHLGADGVHVVRSGGRGPAAARNIGCGRPPPTGSSSSTTTWSPHRAGGPKWPPTSPGCRPASPARRARYGCRRRRGGGRRTGNGTRPA